MKSEQQLSLALNCQLFCIVFCILQVCVQPAHAINDTVQSIKLIQRHFFLGQSELILSKNALRLTNQSGLKFILLSKGPKWDVTVFQPGDKTFCTQNFHEFCDSGLMSDLLIGRSARMPVPNFFHKSSTFLGGQKIEQLTGHGSTIKYLPVEKICEPEAAAILYAVFKVPTNGGIPIAFSSDHRGTDFVSGMKQTNANDIVLETLAISRVYVTGSVFEPPKEYKRCNSIREVVAGKKSRMQSEDIDELFKTK